MQIQCPCCGEQFPFESGFADADGKRLAALLAGLEPKLGRAVLNYLRLFSPAKRGLRMTKAIRLIEELLDLVNAGSVQRDARTNDSKPATPRLWAAGIEQMIAGRERLQLPLEGHGYLRAVVYGIAADPAQVAQVAPAKPARAAVTATAQQLIQEAIGRIDADQRLGLIDEEEAERRRQAARGNHG
ncbi:hypothetical protein [Zestomonas carbonaria]|uniref:Uncharacterized protein n=1 Tax=Zestomonas carbonaria TaxID=2762745 RepID=A0A7U7ELG0_9GAMM|nr:hypothetical protein [Pseudomonas carbonaria]CAD5107194.1 hypothetical protein PSEWESI4_01465 [Pseudomonas carbonaria]